MDSIIGKTTYPDYEIIVLDNNSASEAFFKLKEEYLQAQPGRIRFIDAPFAFNFSKLMNLGVSHSRGKYILMLNNDGEVMQADWMEKMAGYAQLQHIGAIGVKLLYPDDTVQHAGIALGINNGDAGHVFAGAAANDHGYHGSLATATNYSAVTAACLMCRKEVYVQAGCMDEQLAIEYNDIDLCLSFLKAGYYNVVLPEVTLHHHESATRAHPFRNRASWQQHEKEFSIFKAKWAERVDNDPFFNKNILRIKTLDKQ
jgi:GT2 family glycosyltransferase